MPATEFHAAALNTARKNAAVVARRYARRCWWASREDLEQEALAAQLDCLPRYDPAQGPWERFAFAAARRAVVTALLRESAPVSCLGRPAKLVGLLRAPLDPEAHILTVPVDAAIDLCRARERVVELLGESDANLILGVMAGWKPAEIAEYNRVPVHAVYTRLAAIRRRLEGDSELHHFWKELS
jgi:DNA-directed RNA polymerase specialized sigma24 family protein